jgi:hypothetical protein
MFGYRHGTMIDMSGDHPFENALAKLDAMRQMAELLRGLSPADAAEVVEWARNQLRGLPPTPGDDEGRNPGARPAAAPGAEAPMQRFPTFGDLFAASRASSGPDRALVAAYWLQACQNGSDFEAAEITRLLTDAGHALANTGATLRLLSSQRPFLVIQTQKKGTSKQARKRYRLTTEGQRRVDVMLAGNGG